MLLMLSTVQTRAPAGNTGALPQSFLSVDEVLKLFAAAWVTKLAQSLCLNLADAFTSDVKFLAHFLKGARAAVIKTEAQAKNLFLSWGKGLKQI